MNSPTVIALLGLNGRSLLLLLVFMDSIDSNIVLFKSVASKGFSSGNANLLSFMPRLARAHANCIEGLPIFGGLMLIALVTSYTNVTDQLAYYFLTARFIQSLFHLASLSPLAVTLRFSAFAVQLFIAVYWCYKLFSVVLA